MTQATVLDNSTSNDLDGVVYHHPVITYNTAEGQKILVTSKRGSISKTEPRKQFTIWYLPVNPEKFIIVNSFPSMQFLELVAGLVCIALSVIYLSSILAGL
jgi:hypothetical protein